MFLVGAFVAVWAVAIAPVVATDMYVNEMGIFEPDQQQTQMIQSNESQQVSMTHIDTNNG